VNCSIHVLTTQELSSELSSASTSRLAFASTMIVFRSALLSFFASQNAFQSMPFSVFRRHTLLSTSARFDADGFSAFFAFF